MKTEKMLERCHAIAATLPEEPRKEFDFCQAHPRETAVVAATVGGLGSMLALLIQDLQHDLNQEDARAGGKLDQLKAAQRVIKSAEKCNPGKPAIHGVWVADGLQCFCDGYRGFRLHNPLTLPAIREGLEPISLGALVNSARDNSVPLELPSVADLKAHIKTETARRKGEGIKTKLPVTWDFGEGLPLVNAQYLLDALEVLPDCIARASGRRPDTAGIYFEATAGDGIVMPSRRPKQ